MIATMACNMDMLANAAGKTSVTLNDWAQAAFIRLMSVRANSSRVIVLVVIKYSQENQQGRKRADHQGQRFGCGDGAGGGHMADVKQPHQQQHTAQGGADQAQCAGQVWGL